MPDSDRSADLQFAIDTARAAGRLVREHRREGVRRLTKTHHATTDEAVTAADRAAQAAVVEAIRRDHPDDGVIGEESPDGQDITVDVRDPAGRNWVIDPIDGTNNFIAGLGNYAVCIGLLEGGVPTVGVVYDVARDVMYAGAAGLGATVDDEPARAPNGPPDKASLLMMTSNLLDQEGRCPQWAGRFLAQTDLKIRVLGTAALEAVMVGAGVAHGAITVNGKLWDAVAPAGVVLAAGGEVVTFDGRPRFPYDVAGYRGAKVPFLAAGPAAVGELVRLMAD